MNLRDKKAFSRVAAASLKAPKGFTLLEVMVALAIISIVLTAVYRLQSMTLAIDQQTRFYVVAPFLARSKLAEFSQMPDEMVDGDSGDFGEDFPAYRWLLGVHDIEADPEVAGGLSDILKKIEITVDFNDNERRYVLRTYRLFP